jgi:hypothetical protein
MDNQKLLPSAKSSSAIVRRASGGNFIEKLKSPEKNDVKQDEKIQQGDLVKEVKVIKDRVEEIKSILNSTISIQKKQQELIRKQEETSRFQEREEKLEKREKKPKKDNKLPEVPKMGILDRINRFITFTLLGFFAVRLIKHLPKILEFIKKLAPVISFIETLAGAFFEGVVNFIDAGYKAYDTVREFTKSIGGEGFQKAFDDFSSKLNLFANLAIIAGMAVMSKGFGDDSNTKGEVNRRGFSRDGRRASKGTQTRYAQRYGRDKFIQKFGKENLKNLPKSLQRSGLEKASRKAAVGVLGKGGTKVVLKFVKPFLNRLPLIGGLIDFGLSVALGESPGKAAFKAIGATVLGAIGTGFGGPLGMFIGGFAGDWAGGKLYDIFFNNKKNVDDKTESIKKQQGGKVPPRRKGSTIGRSIKRKIRRNITTPKPKQPKIGASVGGKNKFKTLFPEPPKNKKSDTMSPFDTLSNVSTKMSEVPFIGPLFNIFGKTILGDAPNKSDYQIVGKAFNAWINSGLEKNMLVGNIGRAFAEGGAIQVEREMKQDISKWVEKSLEELVKSKVTEAINQFRKNLGLKPLQSGESGISGISGDQTESSTDASLEMAGGAVSPSDLYKEIGANAEQWDIFRNSLALIESGGNYNIFGGSGKHYDGRYQMGEAAKKDGSRVAGVPYPGHSSDPNNSSRVAYRNNPQLQETIFTGYTIANHRYLMRNNKYSSANVERKLQILGYAHNQGMGGAEKWLNTGQVGADGFGTKGTKYTDLIAKNFRAKKSGGALEIAGGSIPIPSTVPGGNPSALPKQSKQIVFHWNAGGGYNDLYGPYHMIIDGSGKIHSKASYSSRTPGSLYRPDALNFAIAANPDRGIWPKQAQLESLVNEIARVAKSWGWSKSSINVRNVSGHGEVGAGRDVGNLSQNISTGRKPSKGPKGSQDNYGPVSWGGDGSRWDLSRLKSSDKIGDGEQKMRSMVKNKMEGGGLFNPDNKKIPEIKTEASYETRPKKIIILPIIKDEIFVG